MRARPYMLCARAAVICAQRREEAALRASMLRAPMPRSIRGVAAVAVAPRAASASRHVRRARVTRTPLSRHALLFAMLSLRVAMQRHAHAPLIRKRAIPFMFTRVMPSRVRDGARHGGRAYVRRYAHTRALMRTIARHAITYDAGYFYDDGAR